MPKIWKFPRFKVLYYFYASDQFFVLSNTNNGLNSDKSDFLNSPGCGLIDDM